MKLHLISHNLYKIDVMLMMMLSFVVLNMFTLTINVSAQNQCPAEQAGIAVLFSDGRNLLFDPSLGLMGYLPATWDSFIRDGGYSFAPCENPSVIFSIKPLNLPADFSAEQFAQKFVDYYAQAGQGYHVVGSGYLAGTNEYSMVLAPEGSETPTLWHAFIPVPERGILYMTTFAPNSSDLYNQYSGTARAIYDSFQTMTEAQANEMMTMISQHDQAMAAAYASAEDMATQAGLQSLQNVIDLLDAGTESDRELREENERYQRQRELGLRP